MGIYTISGENLSSAYEISGSDLSSAFSVNGEVVFTKTGMLKVMQYNVGTWYEGKHTNVPAAKDDEYYSLQDGMIQRNNPDILCMNEYCKQFSKTGRTALSMLQQYFPYIHEQGGDNPDASNSNGRCIASKYPITNYTVRNFNDGSGLYYDSCTITVDGNPITVIVTHLFYSASDASKRVSELQTIISFMRTQERCILCGDLNTLDCKSTSGADYVSMIRLLLDAGFHVANCGDFGFLVTYSDEPTGTWTGCLDNIVTSSNIQILSARVDTTKLTDGLQEHTDHMPLIAELSISGE
jgi:endonuclease/exonuclease/phosphatase family metal-dependent hydrolase